MIASNCSFLKIESISFSHLNFDAKVFTLVMSCNRLDSINLSELALLYISQLIRGRASILVSIVEYISSNLLLLTEERKMSSDIILNKLFFII